MSSGGQKSRLCAAESGVQTERRGEVSLQKALRWEPAENFCCWLSVWTPGISDAKAPGFLRSAVRKRGLEAPPWQRGQAPPLLTVLPCQTTHPPQRVHTLPQSSHTSATGSHTLLSLGFPICEFQDCGIQAFPHWRFPASHEFLPGEQKGLTSNSRSPSC